MSSKEDVIVSIGFEKIFLGRQAFDSQLNLHSETS
jgi:hypothetical protein